MTLMVMAMAWLVYVKHKNMDNIDNFFTENINNSGAGACSYNETAINIDTGYGDGSHDDICFNKGTGRKISQFAMLSDNYKNSGGGGGLAKGFNTDHLKLKKINYNGRHR